MGGADRRVLASAGLALSLADIVVGFVGAAPVVGDIIKAVRDVIVGINNAYKQVYEVVDAFTLAEDTASDVFYSVSSFKKLQDIVPLINALQSKVTDEQLVRKLYVDMGKEIINSTTDMLNTV